MRQQSVSGEPRVVPEHFAGGVPGTAAASAATVMCGTAIDLALEKHTQRTLTEGRQIFRFDTFGDEAFWGDTIKLHQAIEGTRFGGVGPGVSLPLQRSVSMPECALYVRRQSIRNLDRDLQAVTLTLTTTRVA
jgi:hypothetical protein